MGLVSQEAGVAVKAGEGRSRQPSPEASFREPAWPGGRHPSACFFSSGRSPVGLPQPWTDLVPVRSGREPTLAASSVERPSFVQLRRVQLASRSAAAEDVPGSRWKRKRVEIPLCRCLSVLPAERTRNVLTLHISSTPDL